MHDILIVEDGRQERERLQGLFQSHGYSVLACETVTEAEQALDREGFRLAILDIGLSDKSGSHLFNTIKRNKKVQYVIIFTGNPSVHLKQRFLEEGAVDYIVKASVQAQNENFLARAREIIGEPQASVPSGIPLEEFLSRYVDEKSRALFYAAENTPPECAQCGTKSYVVTFSGQQQLPPEIVGRVVCSSCGSVMDPKIG